MAVPFFIRVVLDVILLLIVAIPILIFFLIGEPYQRGFYCTDSTIRYPYKDSTVTSAVLYAFGTAIPVITIVCIEFFYIRKVRSRSDKRETLNKYIKTLYRILGAFFFGCAVSHLTVDICKYTVGRLRPHFIDVCQPDWNQVNCTSDPLDYVEEDVCTTDDEDKLKEARLSFISGHASFSTFTMFFLIIYLQTNWRLKQLHLVRPLYQFLLFVLALFTCLSRISDNKHHWSDVLAGSLNGLGYAILITFFVAKLFHKKFRFPHQPTEGDTALQQMHSNQVSAD